MGKNKSKPKKTLKKKASNLTLKNWKNSFNEKTG